MNRHLLVATDGSYSAHRSLKYIAGIYQGIPDVDVTLISIAMPLPSFLTQGSDSFQLEKSRLERLKDIDIQRQQDCADVLERAKVVLRHNKFPADRIHTKAFVHSQGVAQSILLEAKQGQYDALVVGRRGLGRMASYFIGSVSYELIQRLKDIPIWIIGDPLPPKRVLIALDDSESSMRAVDHASFALADIEDIEITILHVVPKFHLFLSREVSSSLEDIESLIVNYSEKEMEKVLSRVQHIFREAKYNPKSIDIKIKKGVGVTQGILAEYEQGEYGTLIAGRRGIGGWEAVFPGSVSSKILHNLTKGAFWIVA